MLRNLAITTLLLAAFACVLSACGNTMNENDEMDSPRLTAQLDSVSSITENAVLTLTEQDGGYLVSATELAAAKVLYGKVAYDATCEHFVGSTPVELADDQLTICIDRPDQGVVEFGWLIANFDAKPGLDGSIDLMRLDFANGAAETARRVSEAPGGPYNHILESEISGSLSEENIPTLTWAERHAADGSNDGLVAVTDFTQIGQQFGESPGATFIAGSQAVDADYNRDGVVSVNDITPISQNLDVVLSGYAILTGPDINTLTEYTRVDRTVQFPTAPTTTSGAIEWTWTGIADIEEDTRFWVQPYDGSGALGEYPSDVGILLEPESPDNTISAVLGINVPEGLPTDGEGNYIILITEWAVDDVWTIEDDVIEGNAESFSFDAIQLTADVEYTEEPGTVYQRTSGLIWYISAGDGLAKVGNGIGGEDSDMHGLLTFNNRGKIEVTAHKVGDTDMSASVGFVLMSVESLALTADTTSPTAGTDVQFTATGTFDWDGIDNGDEVEQDLTNWCNWSAVSVPADADFSIDTYAGTMDTTGGTGANVTVRTEYPRTENVTLYDNERKLSNPVTVTIN